MRTFTILVLAFMLAACASKPARQHNDFNRLNCQEIIRGQEIMQERMDHYRSRSNASAGWNILGAVTAVTLGVGVFNHSPSNGDNYNQAKYDLSELDRLYEEKNCARVY